MDIDTKDPNKITLKSKSPGAQGQGQKIKPTNISSIRNRKKRLISPEEGVNDPQFLKQYSAGGLVVVKVTW